MIDFPLWVTKPTMCYERTQLFIERTRHGVVRHEVRFSIPVKKGKK